MKRMVASRKLKRQCDCCQKGFAKGDVYYHKRVVWTFFDGKDDVVIGVDKTECPRCRYKKAESERRYADFQNGCQHEKRDFIHEVWDYIPGEAVMEPQYDVCGLCGNKFY